MALSVGAQRILKTLTASRYRVLRCARRGLRCRHAHHSLPPGDSVLLEACSRLDARVRMLFLTVHLFHGPEHFPASPQAL